MSSIPVGPNIRVKSGLAQQFMDYFFFTVIGFVVGGGKLIIFAAGDGVYYVNGERHQIGPFPDNAPPYFAYRLLEGFDKHSHRIRIVAEYPIEKVDNFLIASDGLTDYEKAQDMLMANGKLVPSIQSLYSDKSIVGHPEGIQRLLRLVQRSADSKDPATGLMKRVGRYLEDDTTIITARKLVDIAGLSE